ncbi:hypothetical protein, partial [Paraburkholderia sediminicola]|uniref:hypothetical protein n=1 Tax=Paraburkholderia sediminicola TaxID=458836 RepID=UPI0038BB08F2
MTVGIFALLSRHQQPYSVAHLTSKREQIFANIDAVESDRDFDNVCTTSPTWGSGTAFKTFFTAEGHARKAEVLRAFALNHVALSSTGLAYLARHPQLKAEAADDASRVPLNHLELLVRGAMLRWPQVSQDGQLVLTLPHSDFRLRLTKACFDDEHGTVTEGELNRNKELEDCSHQASAILGAPAELYETVSAAFLKKGSPAEGSQRLLCGRLSPLAGREGVGSPRGKLEGRRDSLAGGDVRRRKSGFREGWQARDGRCHEGGDYSKAGDLCRLVAQHATDTS